MHSQTIESALKDIIRSIQENSGLDCPQLNASTVPTDEVPEFDSKVWIAATTLLAAETGIDIPKDENIFIDKETKSPLTISQIGQLVCKISEVEESSGQAA